MKHGKYKSRKNRKRALGLGKTGHEGTVESNINPSFRLDGIVARLKSAFGSSKHRKARIQRFQARHRAR